MYTYDQIADQLTDGFWASFGGGPRSFDVVTGGTLYVDITGLASNGQAMARQALDAWTSVTGINFVEIDSSIPPNQTVSEFLDAPSNPNTPYAVQVGDDFLGSLGTGADRDTVAIALTAGQNITIELSGNTANGNATADPFLWLLDGAGNVIAANDDAFGTDAALTYQAATTGVHYIQAGSFNDAYPGDYRISVRDAAGLVDIVFDDEQSGAYATSSVSGGVIQTSFVNIDSAWAGGSARTDGYFYQTYLHEIGHALGLGHAGNYNGSATYGTDALYLNDSWQASVMSYFHQVENTWLNADFAYAITPMMADIIAIQNLYGAPSANQGDTIYGDGGNTGTYLDAALGLSNPVAFTVFDTGGTDLFDFSSYSAHQVMDLREEAFSDLAGLDGNIGIARGTIIENGRTGGGNDVITGNTAANGLSAGSGDDTINGGAGNDALSGGSGLDNLDGGDGFDLIDGGPGGNTLNGGAGADLLIGDGGTLSMLTTIYPAWTPPANAQSLLDTGDVIVLWDDILQDSGLA
ncbi:MAG: hypothetical protein HKN98_13540 [Silicimonas sp.]|nr:hypothetical protein [Silicimonas sp.]